MLLAAEKNNVLLMEAVKSTLAPNFFAIQENLHKLGKIRNTGSMARNFGKLAFFMPN